MERNVSPRLGREERKTRTFDFFSVLAALEESAQPESAQLERPPDRQLTAREAEEKNRGGTAGRGKMWGK